jgi:hydroxymethylglutaryl-CoA lyase
MPFPKQVKLVEVSPRDGLQNEAQSIPTGIKIEFINRLSDTGLSVIEATSFVSPKWIPQLADGREVFLGIKKKPGVSYPVLVPNIQGLERALAVGAKEIAVFTTPSEQFSQKNTHCTVAESVERIAEIMTVAKEHQLHIRGYLSCVLGCPYEGKMAPEKVSALAGILFNRGCDEISLGDTIGVGTPINTRQLLDAVSKSVPIEHLAVHFHDTYGQALVNIYVALEYGIAVIDSSVAGLGGCPYATGAAGNVATEDVLYMLIEMGIETGVDLKKLIAVGRFISQQLGREPKSRVNLAL